MRDTVFPDRRFTLHTLVRVYPDSSGGRDRDSSAVKISLEKIEILVQQSIFFT